MLDALKELLLKPISSGDSVQSASNNGNQMPKGVEYSVPKAPVPMRKTMA